MDKKIVIIIPNELETNLPVFKKICEWHQEAMFKFIYYSGINLYGKEKESADTIAKCLADLGFCTILIDEYRNNKLLIAYIPTHISPRQLEYFKKGKETFKKYTNFLALREEDSSYKIIDNHSTNEALLDILISELSNRLSTPKTKTLKKEINQEKTNNK